MDSLAACDALLESLADRARQLCESDWCAIGLRDRTANSVRVRRWAASPRGLATTLPAEPARLFLRDGPSRERSRPGGPHPRSDPLVAGTLLSLALPIPLDGKVEGVICIGRRSSVPFTDRDEACLALLADHVAERITHTGLLQEARAEARRQRRIAEALALVTRATSRPFDVRSLGQQIVDTLLLLVGGARATLFAQDPGTGGYRLVAVARRDGLTANGDVAAPEPGPVESLAARTGRLVSTADFVAEPGLLPPLERPSRDGVPIRAVVATPLLHGDTTLGVLSIGDQAGRRFETEELNVFLAAADHAAVALQTAYLHAQVTEAALVQERIRIANELHDTLSQLAFSVGLKLDWCLHRVGHISLLRPKLEDIRHHAGQIMAQIRQLIGHLAAEGPCEMTFPRRSESLVNDFRELTGASVEFSLEGDPSRLSPAAQEAVQKMLREALVNVAKHARATRTTVRIDVGGEEAAIAIADNGVGLPDGTGGGTPVEGFGLRQMRERIESLGGRLEILTDPDSGVCVRGVFPLE